MIKDYINIEIFDTFWYHLLLMSLFKESNEINPQEQLCRVYGEVCQDVDKVFGQRKPNLPRPALLVVPDSNFNEFIQKGISDTPVGDDEIIKKKRAEIVEMGATGAYMQHVGVILLPESTARMFESGELSDATARCVLAKQYIYHLTTPLSGGYVDRIGFYKFPKMEREDSPHRSGVVYSASIDDVSIATVPEVSGEKEILLTGNAINLLVNLVTLRSNWLSYSDERLVCMVSSGKDGSKEPMIFHPTDKIIDGLIRSLLSCKTNGLGLTVPEYPFRNKYFSMKLWLEKPDNEVMLIDPKMRSKNEALDVFDYQDPNNYPRK